MKLVINGIPIPREQFTGANATSVDISEVQTDGLRKAIVSQEYTLTGAAFEMVETELINDPNGKNKFLPVQIYEDTCCETDILLFEGILRGDMVDWCYEDCQCTVAFLEQTEEVLRTSCIKSTLVYDNWNGFQQAVHPRITYCTEVRPDWMAYALLISGIMYNWILFLLYPIVFAIQAINSVLGVLEDALGAIGINVNLTINFEGNDNVLQAYDNLLDDLNQRIVGCGRKHPSPLVRDYIQNVCDKCGLQFSSTIYKDVNSQYYNAVYLSAPVEKGTRNEDITWLDQNHPILTLDLFLDQLKLVHNGDYKVINGTLYFERKDFFWTGDIFASYSLLFDNNLIKDRLCLSWRDETRPSFIKLQYSLDAVDVVGTEAIDRYNDIVEWNLPYSELQSGFTEVVLPFGPARFRGDGIDTDILGQFSWAPFSIGQQINTFQNTLLLEKGTCFQPKLLIWDGVNITDAKIRKYDVPGFEIDPGQNYNFPYLFNEYNADPNTAYPTDHPFSGLYPRFYSIDNPKLIADQGQQFEFSMYYNCDSLQAALTARFVQLPMGVGRIDKITVNLEDKSLSIIGKV